MHGPLSLDYDSLSNDQHPGLSSERDADRVYRETAQVVVLGTDSGMKEKVLALLSGADVDLRSHETLAECLSTLQSAPSVGNSFSGNGDRGYGGLGSVAAVIAVGPLGNFAQTCPLDDVRSSFPGARLVAATDDAPVTEVLGLIRLGVSDVLLLGESHAVNSEILGQAIAKGRTAAREATEMMTLSQQLATLTPAEHQVLDAMLDGMANKQIAQALEIGLRTVELRRSKIMRKMEAKSLAQLIKFVCTAMRAEQPA